MHAIRRTFTALGALLVCGPLLADAFASHAGVMQLRPALARQPALRLLVACTLPRHVHCPPRRKCTTLPSACRTTCRGQQGPAEPKTPPGLAPRFNPRAPAVRADTASTACLQRASLEMHLMRLAMTVRGCSDSS